ncbi:MAG TPA: PhoH family protein [Rhizomicrobium sp.]|nr:PhoH family protein [Rhizomicrobium sp.]
MSAKKTQAATLEFPDNKLLRALGGPHAKHFARIEQKLNVGIDMRGNLVAVEGKDRERAGAILRALYLRLAAGESVTMAEVDAEIRFTDEARVLAPGAIKTSSSRAVRPRSLAQAAYLEMMRQCPLVFGIGPAGTGKTYLAAAFAAHMLHEKRVERLILSRPALEAGERLGFLPGDLKEKIDPYLRPLYDALFDVLGDGAGRLMEQGIIEVAPLAFMRGRTLNRAFVILDEAQNTTQAQIKMALTRLGEDSHMVVTGDPSQSDLPGGLALGLNEALSILDGVEGVGVARFGEKDVVRHPLVARIVDAYNRKDQSGDRFLGKS